jgi:amino acid transporter
MTELATQFDSHQEAQPAFAETNPRKYGTFVGVFVPAILMLFGVIIFLRLGWIVGMAGLSTTMVIITLASLIALISVLSMSAIATNIEVKAGGIYYILSRSLGFEVGSAIGLPLYLKECLTIAFCVIGFAESLKDLIPSWDISYIGLSTLAILTFLASTSTRSAMKVQMVIFIITIVTLVSLFTGTELGPDKSENALSLPLKSFGFWALFSIFFPAMTGIESSVSLSGNLKNPSRSLPIGTISAILVGFFIYASVAYFLVYHVPAERLVEDPFVMVDLASVPSLIVVGIWGATLSSALGGLLGAPRTLKAMADDGLAPKIFSKTFGAMEEPMLATLLTCFITLLGIWFGSVNLIAPLLTMISLICYAVLNFSAGIETLIANPSWRPLVRIHWAVSIAGAVLCLIAMLMIAPDYALLSLFAVSLIYIVMKKKDYKASWTDIKQGMLLYFSQLITYSLAYGSSVSKSWRPHFLVFTKFSIEHSAPLLKFSEAISQSKGFLTMASFVEPGRLTRSRQKEMQKEMAVRFQSHNIKSFVKVSEAPSVNAGMQQMMEYYGLGPLAPNTILFGGIKKEDKLAEFVEVMQTAIARHFNIVIMNDDYDAMKVEDPTKKEIHVWWDDSHLDSSNLMLVLAYMLKRNPKYKCQHITVKAVVTDELQKKNKLQELQKLSIEKRLPINVEVYVSLFEIEERFALVKEFSKDAEIILMSLAPPPKQNENVEEYTKYLQTISQSTENISSLVLVLSSKHTPLEAILQ